MEYDNFGLVLYSIVCIGIGYIIRYWVGLWTEGRVAPIGSFVNEH